MTDEQIIQLEDLKKEFYARYSNDGAYDLIEQAYRLGWKDGYDDGCFEATGGNV